MKSFRFRTSSARSIARQAQPEAVQSVDFAPESNLGFQEQSPVAAFERGTLLLRAAGIQSVPISLSGMRALLKASQAEKEGLDTEQAGRRIEASAGAPLPEAIRVRMESAFGHDFSHVRIHTDGASGEAALGLNALAFTMGNEIFFGRGQFTPETSGGLELLAHELTHVVQHDERRLPGVMGEGLDVSSPVESHEREAVAWAREILGGGMLEGSEGRSEVGAEVSEISTEASPAMREATVDPNDDITTLFQEIKDNDSLQAVLSALALVSEDVAQNKQQGLKNQAQNNSASKMGVWNQEQIDLSQKLAADKDFWNKVNIISRKCKSGVKVASDMASFVEGLQALKEAISKGSLSSYDSVVAIVQASGTATQKTGELISTVASLISHSYTKSIATKLSQSRIKPDEIIDLCNQGIKFETLGKLGNILISWGKKLITIAKYMGWAKDVVEAYKQIAVLTDPQKASSEQLMAMSKLLDALTYFVSAVPVVGQMFEYYVTGTSKASELLAIIEKSQKVTEELLDSFFVKKPKGSDSDKISETNNSTSIVEPEDKKVEKQEIPEDINARITQCRNLIFYSGWTSWATMISKALTLSSSNISQEQKESLIKDIQNVKSPGYIDFSKDKKELDEFIKLYQNGDINIQDLAGKVSALERTLEAVDVYSDKIHEIIGLYLTDKELEELFKEMINNKDSVEAESDLDNKSEDGQDEPSEDELDATEPPEETETENEDVLVEDTNAPVAKKSKSSSKQDNKQNTASDPNQGQQVATGASGQPTSAFNLASLLNVPDSSNEQDPPSLLAVSIPQPQDNLQQVDTEAST